MAVKIDQPANIESSAPVPVGRQARRGEPNLNALTGLRVFAALGVVVYHFARPALNGWPAPLLNLAGSGYTAVSLFFLLSGFILSYSYLNGAGEMRGTRRAFYVSRFARIYPAYLLAFLLAAPTNIIWSLRVNHLPTAALKLMTSALAVLTLQQSWTPWTAWAWNFPAWSVSVEAFFYLSFPFLAPRLARLRPSACIKVAGALWIAALIAPVCLYLAKGTTGAPELSDHLQMAVEFTPLLRLPEFAIGILLGRAYRLGFSFGRLSAPLSYLSATAILVTLALCPSIPHPLLANGLLVPLFACLLFSLAHAKGLLARFLSQPLIVMLGEASYGIYILQIPIAYVLRLPPPHTSLKTFGIYLFALLCASVLSWRFVESPLRIRIREWLTGNRKQDERLRARLASEWAQATAPLTGVVDSK